MSTLALSPTETKTTRSSALRLRLRAITFEYVSFDLHDPFGFVRAATVAVGAGAAGATWHAAVRFPNLSHGEAGETTGDASLDREIRGRAGDLLVLLESATNVRAAA